MYTERKRGQVEIMLGLSNYYFPVFEETLDKYDLPLELKYLPIIESALNPKAISRMGANGLWQFMYGTGKNMKLEINSLVDERRDPLKSTDAAARYLKQLYDMYGDWHLAIAAYNCGPGNVNRAIKRSGDKTNYWEIYYRLPRETRGYVPAYIAAAYVMNYYSEHNLVPRVPDMSLFSDTLVVNDYLHFDQVAANLNIDKEELRTLNPMYRRDIIPAKKDKPYPIILPNNKIMEFMSKDSLIFAHERDKFFPDNTLIAPSENTGSNFTPVDIKGKAKIFYTVKQGDNPGYIAAWFKVRTTDLNYWNNINRNMIRVGQKLVVYVPENQKERFEKINEMTFAQKQEMIGKSTTSSQSKPEVLDPNYDYYTVKKGDTLMEIARQYAGITSTEIMQLNNLTSDRSLYIGQKLKIKRKS
jgi:membrane-bound lytic murein transglycosylase D